MPIDRPYLNALKLDARIGNSKVESYEVDGVLLDLPLVQPGASRRHRDWQRRVLEDIIPDSVNADAPERTPFRILWALTPPEQAKVGIDDVMKGEMEPLRPLFRATTSASRALPIAFHVLAVRGAAKGEADAKGFTERTFLLLCRRPDGSLNEDLARRTVEAFREDPKNLDLAQRTVLERIERDWDPATSFPFELPSTMAPRLVPFDPKTGEIFQKDLTCLLDARLPPGDFFQSFNQLLMLHMGLFQVRLATVLAPQIDLLMAELHQSSPGNLTALEALEEQLRCEHPLRGKLYMRAPDADTHRPVSLDSPERRAYDRLGDSLHRFHFDVQLFGQIRRVTQAWLLHHGWGREEAEAKLRRPVDILRRLQEDPSFRIFFEHAFEVLSLRFIRDQVSEGERARQEERVSGAASGLHALRMLYEHFNLASAKNPTSSRAYRQGLLVTNSLLRHNQYGLIQGRAKVGHFLQLGAGLLPLLLLLAVGAGREKAPVAKLWSHLEDYGLFLAEEERERILRQLKSMGLYERYSDAGEAAYVRNLITTA
jgi:hypothetical protein